MSLARTSSLPFHEIQAIAAETGFHLIGVKSVGKLQKDVALQRLEKWQTQGYAADMAYMYREPKLFLDIEHFLPKTASILTLSVPYETRDPGPTPQGYGRVARYAWGRDYHRIIKKRLRELQRKLESTYAIQTRSFTDAVPLLERALGEQSALGFVGKNTMLIRPGMGSFHFLAEVLLTHLVDEPELMVRSVGCSSCQRCLGACPTDAFPEPWVLDARRCISYLTIEKRGTFEDWERRALGDWIFGCDICQEVCPFNHRGLKVKPWDELTAEKGSGSHLDLSEVLSLADDKDYAERFSGTPLMRAGREGLLRNACAVAANTRSYNCLDELKRLRSCDTSAALRVEAQKALEALSERN